MEHGGGRSGGGGGPTGRGGAAASQAVSLAVSETAAVEGTEAAEGGQQQSIAGNRAETESVSAVLGNPSAAAKRDMIALIR